MSNNVLADEDDKVFACNSLRMCIVTTLNWGLRNGGGIGDVLRNVAPDVRNSGQINKYTA